MDYEADVLLKINDYKFDYKLFNALKTIKIYNSQRKAAKELNIAHTVLNRRIKNAEKKLNTSLVDIKGVKSYLSKDAEEILSVYDAKVSRISNISNIVIAGGHIVSGLIEVLSKKGNFKVDVYSSDDESAFKLAERDLIDILCLDDPLIAFKEDLDFTPICYDHLVLISKNFPEIKKLTDLNDSRFISVANSSQRLAWKILNDHDVNFEIINEVKSPYEAYKLVKSSDDVYTFLNASFFSGNEILKKETQHVISLVNLRKDDDKTKEFINYILNDGQNELEKYGFEPL